MFKERNIIFYKTYFQDFYLAQTGKVQGKIEYVLRLIKQVERIPSTYLKHIEGTDGLYEIRIKHASDIYRIFCCFDSGSIVVLFNGFQKKSQKNPKTEIDAALKLMKEYKVNRRHNDEK